MSDIPPSDLPEAPPEPASESEFTDFEQSFLDTVERRFHPDETQVAPDETGLDSGASDGGPPVEGQEPPSESSQPDEGEAPDAGPGQPASVFTLSGTDYTADQLAQAIQVRDYFAQLPPNYIQAIDALVSGQYHLVPNNQQVAASPQQQQPPSSATTPPQVPPEDPYSGGAWDQTPDPQFLQLKSEVEELKAVINNTLPNVVQRQHNDDYNARLQEITSASDSFQKQYDLNEDQMRALEANIVQAQILPALQNRYQSLQGGMNAALEQMFWSTPDLRDPYLQRVQASRQAETTAQETDNLRKQQLTALSASGGSAPRREPVPSTPEDRWAAVAAEIADSMNGSGTIQ